MPGFLHNFGKQPRIKSQIKELQRGIVAESVKCGHGISEAFGEETKKLTGASEKLSQMPAAWEALCFFLHALNRAAFRPRSEYLRERIFDPTSAAMARLFAKMIATMSDKYDEVEIDEAMVDLIAVRELQFSEAPVLIGTTPDDERSALQLAAGMIAESTGHSGNAVLMLIVRVHLMRGLKALDLPAQVKRIEAAL